MTKQFSKGNIIQKGYLTKTIGILLQLLVLVTGIVFCSRPVSEPEMPDYFSLEFSTLQGTKSKLANYKNKPIALNFWSSECEECPEANQITNKILDTSNKKFQLIGINTDKAENYMRAQKFSNKFDIHYDSFHDPDLLLVQKLQVERQPSLVLLIPTEIDYLVYRLYDLNNSNLAELQKSVTTMSKGGVK